jgi:hypothetical protein
MTPETIEQIIQSSHSSDQKTSQPVLSCLEAHHISERFSVTLIEIGHYCHQNGIKISDCQLGCFGQHRLSGSNESSSS